MVFGRVEAKTQQNRRTGSVGLSGSAAVILGRLLLKWARSLGSWQVTKQSQVHLNSKLSSPTLKSSRRELRLREFLPVPHAAHTELQATGADRPPPPLARPTLWFAGISTPRPLWPPSPAPSVSVCLYPCCLRRRSPPQSERLRRR